MYWEPPRSRYRVPRRRSPPIKWVSNATEWRLVHVRLARLQPSLLVLHALH
jgi:hypothetical protein